MCPGLRPKSFRVGKARSLEGLKSGDLGSSVRPCSSRMQHAFPSCTAVMINLFVLYKY